MCLDRMEKKIIKSCQESPTRHGRPRKQLLRPTKYAYVVLGTRGFVRALFKKII